MFGFLGWLDVSMLMGDNKCLSLVACRFAGIVACCVLLRPETACSLHGLVLAIARRCTFVPLLLNVGGETGCA
jgi:O-antigen ligase